MKHVWVQLENGMQYLTYPPKYDFCCSTCNTKKVASLKQIEDDSSECKIPSNSDDRGHEHEHDHEHKQQSMVTSCSVIKYKDNLSLITCRRCDKKDSTMKIKFAKRSYAKQFGITIGFVGFGSGDEYEADLCFDCVNEIKHDILPPSTIAKTEASTLKFYGTPLSQIKAKPCVSFGNVLLMNNPDYFTELKEIGCMFQYSDYTRKHELITRICGDKFSDQGYILTESSGTFTFTCENDSIINLSDQLRWAVFKVVVENYNENDKLYAGTQDVPKHYNVDTQTGLLDGRDLDFTKFYEKAKSTDFKRNVSFWIGNLDWILTGAFKKGNTYVIHASSYNLINEHNPSFFAFS